MKGDVDQIIAFNGNLTLEQKAIVEFMRDGPRSTGQSGALAAACAGSFRGATTTISIAT